MVSTSLRSAIALAFWSLGTALGCSEDSTSGSPMTMGGAGAAAPVAGAEPIAGTPGAGGGGSGAEAGRGVVTATGGSSAAAAGRGGSGTGGGAAGMLASGGRGGRSSEAGRGGMGEAGRGGAAGGSGGSTGSVDSSCAVGPVPDEVRRAWNLTAFYQKYADAGGIPIVTSEQPVDKTLTLACQLVNEMVSERDDVRQALIRNKSHFTIIGVNELTNDTPEFSNLPDSINQRARGLGGKAASCAEESILCDRMRDRWRGESICVHEFSHTISMYGLFAADSTFQRRLDQAWRSAIDAGLYRNTYATESAQEYWAEGVQDWYDTNLQSMPANGVHNEINTKAELKSYDPTLYALIDELLPENVRWPDCYRSTPLP